jgi:hypothetical protein
MRRIVRGSKFKIGDQVIVEGDASGDYLGKVTARHLALTKPVSSTPGSESGVENQTKPGITVRVSRWEGMDLDYKMDIVVWDEEARHVGQ